MLVGLGPTSWALGIGVATFTLASGLASTLLLVLNLMNGQYFSYISLLAAVVSLDKFNAFGQQLHTIFNFAEIEQKSYDMAIAYFRCRGEESLPLFTAPDKISEFSISAFLFLVNTQGILFFYWSLILFSSSWSLQPVWWKNNKIVTLTKLTSFIIPGVQSALLRVPAIRDSDVWNLIVMNAIILVNIGMASIFLLLTLFHVLHIHVRARGGTRIRLSRTYDGVIEYVQSPLPPSPLHGIRKFLLSSDGWLIGRIVLAFLMVEGLQIYMIVMQIFFLDKWAHFKVEWQNGLQMPVVDQAEEFANLCSPIPASFTGFLMLGVFGSTVENRQAFGRLIRAVLCMKRRDESIWHPEDDEEYNRKRAGGTPDSEWSDSGYPDLKIETTLDIKVRIPTPTASPRESTPLGSAPTYRYSPSSKPPSARSSKLIRNSRYRPRSGSPPPSVSALPTPPLPSDKKKAAAQPPLNPSDPAVLATFQFPFALIGASTITEGPQTATPPIPVVPNLGPRSYTESGPFYSLNTTTAATISPTAPPYSPVSPITEASYLTHPPIKSPIRGRGSKDSNTIDRTTTSLRRPLAQETSSQRDSIRESYIEPLSAVAYSPNGSSASSRLRKGDIRWPWSGEDEELEGTWRQ